MSESVGESLEKLEAAGVYGGTEREDGVGKWEYGSVQSGSTTTK